MYPHYRPDDENHREQQNEPVEGIFHINGMTHLAQLFRNDDDVSKKHHRQNRQAYADYERKVSFHYYQSLSTFLPLESFPPNVKPTDATNERLSNGYAVKQSFTSAYWLSGTL